jgi:hypothetical protein
MKVNDIFFPSGKLFLLFSSDLSGGKSRYYYKKYRAYSSRESVPVGKDKTLLNQTKYIILGF